MALDRKNRQKAVWGVFFIALGAFLLMVQMDLVHVREIWRWWPSVLTLIGLVHVLAPDNPRQFASGVTNVLLSLWFFACTWNWYGLTYLRSWPLLLVIFGFDIVLAGLLGRGGKEGGRHA